MRILAVNFGHDPSFAYFKDGELIAFEELGRQTGNKMQFGVGARHIEAFLDRSGINFHDVDAVAICSTQGWRMRHCNAIGMKVDWPHQTRKSLLAGDWPSAVVREGRDGSAEFDALADADGLFVESPSVRKERFTAPYVDGPVADLAAVRQLVVALLDLPASKAKQRLKDFLVPFDFQLRGTRKPAFYVEHHACHAHYAHFYSASPSSIICTHDGGAPSYPFNSGGVYLSHSTLGVLPLVRHNLALGTIYDQVSEAVGLGGEPGKLMGLASYANPSPTVLTLVDKALKAFASRNWGEICDITRQVLAVSETDLALRHSAVERFTFDLPHWPIAIQAAANTQLLVQTIFTMVVGRIATAVAECAPDLNTVDLAGGFTFNCPSNQLLQQQFPTLKVNPLPAAGDTGISIGAAILLHRALGIPVNRSLHREGLVAAFPPSNTIPSVLSRNTVSRRIDVAAQDIPEFIAQAIAQGKVLCLFRGRSEVGPRALGHRSIIGPATVESVRDRINASKGREAWRPLAPLCREEDFSLYFDGDPKLARYMLFTFRVLRPDLPAVTHVDGTARVQCIDASDRWLFPALTRLKEFGQAPVIINTSFNCAGDPIVETIDQAMDSFIRMGFDYLVTERGVFSAMQDGLRGRARRRQLSLDQIPLDAGSTADVRGRPYYS